jgi:hypothetical protein
MTAKNEVVIPTRGSTNFASPPSKWSLELARSAGRRVYNRSLRIRRGFLLTREAAPSPLAELLRGGRGGGTRLKVYLAILWIAGAPPYDTRFPARTWAALLDLEDPYIKGARRVTDALAFLEDHRLLTIERSKGEPSVVTLLREDGSGRKYTPPAPEEGKRLSQADRYIRVPSHFLTHGWLPVLSARAIALLLVLRDRQPVSDKMAEQEELPSRPSAPFWTSPSEARSNYGLSADTWTRGTQELAAHGLVWVTRRPVSKDEFDQKRRRNEYRLVLRQLGKIPGDDDGLIATSLDLGAQAVSGISDSPGPATS